MCGIEDAIRGHESGLLNEEFWRRSNEAFEQWQEEQRLKDERQLKVVEWYKTHCVKELQ